MTVLINLVYIVPALLMAVVVHEYSHGKVADLLGDPTPRLAGRLTLNPLPHLDPFSSVLLPLILIFIGSPIVFAAAKPVPINPLYLRGGRRSLIWVGVAGPLSNLVVAALAGLGASSIWGILPYFIQQFMVTLVILNIILAVFNLIPVPPLDGSRIVEGFLPARYLPAFRSIERFGILILFAFLIFFNRFFWAIVGPIMDFFTSLFLRGVM